MNEELSVSALPSDRAVVPAASSPQAVSPVPASIPSAGMWSNATYARKVGQLLRLAAGQCASLTEGMWNPRFCAADATDKAMSFCEDARAIISDIERRYLAHASAMSAGTAENAQQAQGDSPPARPEGDAQPGAAS